MPQVLVLRDGIHIDGEPRSAGDVVEIDADELEAVEALGAPERVRKLTAAQAKKAAED